MRDASAHLWQAIVFLLVALGYAILSPDLALFPYLRLAAVLILILVSLAMLGVRQRAVLASSAVSAVAAVGALSGGGLVFYELVFVVPAARIGMLGLAAAYIVAGLLGCAANACLGAGRQLWRLRAINPYFPQVGVAPPDRKPGNRWSSPTRGDAA